LAQGSTRTVARKSSIGGLYVRAGGLTFKCDKTSTNLCVSYFNLGVLGALFGGISPPKPLVTTGLGSAYENNVPAN